MEVSLAFDHCHYVLMVCFIFFFSLFSWILKSLFLPVLGETLQDERTNGGAFVASDGVQFPHKLIPVSP